MKKSLLLLLLFFVYGNYTSAQILCVSCYQQNGRVSPSVTNLLLNGGFESGTCVPFPTYSANFCPNSGYYSCDIANWTCTGGGGATYAEVYDNTLTIVPEGAKAVYFGNYWANACSSTVDDTSCLVSTGCTVTGIPDGYPENPDANYGGATGVSLEQTVTGLTPCNTYVLEFWAGGEWGFTHSGLFAVDIGFGKTYLRCKPTKYNTADIGTRYLIQFRATSTSHTIKFTNWGHISHSCTELVLDDVRLYTLAQLSASVPACSSVLTAAVSQSDLTCNGQCTGTATALPTGGTCPYTYAWNSQPVQTSQTATGLCAGTFTVTITDAANATTTAAASIIEPNALTSPTSASPASCANNNGTATANPTGGTPGYTFAWNSVPVQTTQTATGLAPGSYTVTITDAGACTVSASATVTAIPLPIVTADDVSGCTGSAIALSGTPAGGTWSVTNPYTGPGTTYTHTFTDANGCTVTSAAANITVNPLPTVTADDVSGCTGSAIILSGTPSGGTWSVANPYTGPGTTYSHTFTDVNGCTNTSASANITINALPTVTADDVSGCTGSAIPLSGTPAGGTWSVADPYTGPGTVYTHTYTDVNGCTNTSAAANITVNPLPAVTADNVSGCPGSSITLSGTPAGGTWSIIDPYTGPDTTYTHSFTDGNGCSNISSPATVTFTPGITFSTSVINTSCGNNNGSIAVHPLTGDAPFTYAWSNNAITDSISGLPPGTYTVTVTGSTGCAASATATVNPGGSTPVTITSNKIIMCAGDSALVCAPAGYVAYQWNNGDTSQCTQVTVAGNYYVTVTDLGSCTANSNHLAINVHPQPPVSISVNGDTLISYNALSYQWYLDGAIIPGATEPMLIAVQTGYYTVLVNDSNGCVALSLPVLVTITSIEELTNWAIMVSPNPFGEKLQIFLRSDLYSGERAQIEIYDAVGRKIYSQAVAVFPILIPTIHWPQGIYLLKSGDWVRKLVKEQY